MRAFYAARLSNGCNVGQVFGEVVKNSAEERFQQPNKLKKQRDCIEEEINTLTDQIDYLREEIGKLKEELAGDSDVHWYQVKCLCSELKDQQWTFIHCAETDEVGIRMLAEEGAIGLQEPSELEEKLWSLEEMVFEASAAPSERFEVWRHSTETPKGDEHDGREDYGDLIGVTVWGSIDDLLQIAQEAGLKKVCSDDLELRIEEAEKGLAEAEKGLVQLRDVSKKAGGIIR